MAVADTQKIDNADNQKTEWKDLPPEQQRDIVKANLAYQLNRAVENGTSVLFDKKSKDDFLKEENIAYSGFSGKPYNGLNALLLDNMKKERGYKRNVWLNVNEIMTLKGNIGNFSKESKSFEKLKNLPFVEIHTIQTQIETPVREKGKLVENKKGEMVEAFKRDANGKVVTEMKKLDRPQLNTHRVYNLEDVARLEGFRINSIKPLDMKRNDKGQFIFMSSAHGLKNDKGENVFDPEKAIVLEELAKINHKGKDKNGKDIDCSLKKEVIDAAKRYYFSANAARGNLKLQENTKNIDYTFPLDKRFATRMNDRIDRVLGDKQQKRDNELKEPTLESQAQTTAPKKEAEVAKTNTKKPQTKAKNKDKKKSNDYGMSM